MARKSKNQMEDLPVDKMDQFIKTNYKAIIGGFGALIVLILAGYAVINFINNNQRNKYEIIGNYELSGFRNIESVRQYSGLANELSFAKDYIHYSAGTEYHALEDESAAIDELSKVGGEYERFAKSLMYDLGSGANPDQGSPLWYYREIMKTDEGNISQLIMDFRQTWPESSLLELIDKWGLE